MTASAIQQMPHQPVREISGRPGVSWGVFLIPAGGKVTMRIAGDMLETNIATSYGLERREIRSRIQRIETVEMVEGRIWWLLWIGIALIAWIIGIIPIVLFFVLKQKCLIVHNASGNLVLFYKNSQEIRDFCTTLMAISRQLNSKSSPAQVAKAPARNGAKPRMTNGTQQRVPQAHRA